MAFLLLPENKNLTLHKNRVSHNALSGNQWDLSKVKKNTRKCCVLNVFLWLVWWWWILWIETRSTVQCHLLNWLCLTEALLRECSNTAGWLSTFAKALYVPPLERVRTCWYARCDLALTTNSEQLVRVPLAIDRASSELNLAASKTLRPLRCAVTLR